MTEPTIRPEPSFRVKQETPRFEGRVVKVFEERIVFPNGFETTHERLELPRAVAVVPLLERDGAAPQVVLVEQLRSSVRGHIHEIPAGILDPGEDPAVCAKRELAEETGYRAGTVSHLATLLPIPGTSGHLMDYYLAEELESGEQSLEEAECLQVKSFPLDDLVAAALGQMCSDECRGVVVDAKTHLGLLHVALRRQRAEGKS